MKEEYVVDKNEPAASSTLNEEGQAAMSRLIEETASVCTTDGHDFRKLAIEYKFGLREYLSAKVDPSERSLLQRIKGSQWWSWRLWCVITERYGVYDQFYGRHNEAWGAYSRFLLRSTTHSMMPHSCLEKEGSASQDQEDSEEWGAESKERKRVALRPLFETEN